MTIRPSRAVFPYFRPSSPALRAEMRRLEQRAKGAGASDRTKYGTSRCSARSYVVHHTQRISLAAAMYV